MKPKPTKKQLVLQKIKKGDTLDAIRVTENVHRIKIAKWSYQYSTSGEDISLFDSEQSVSRYQKLSEKQVEWIYLTILNKTPKDFGFEIETWNRYIIQKLIRHWCLKDYPTDHVYKLIEELGLIFPKYEIDLNNETNQEIFRNLKQQKQHIYYLNHLDLKKTFKTAQSSQSKKGCIIHRTKPVETNKIILYAESTQKKGIKFCVFPKPIDSKVLIAFLESFYIEAYRDTCLILNRQSIFFNYDVLNHAREHFFKLKMQIIE